MSDLRTIPRKFLSEFIALYRRHSCLWKIKCKDFSDRNKKNAAYEELRIKLLEIDSEATKDDVVKKINSLRTCFRKELKKVHESSKSKKRTEKIYRPSLWYYEELTFLVDQELPGKGFSNPVELGSEENSRNECISGVDVSVVSLPEENSPNLSSEREKQIVDNSDQNLTLARTENSPNLSSEGMKQKVNNSDQNLTPARLEENKFIMFGKHVAQELHALPHEMALYCKKVINDAIFEAQMGNLNRSSRIVTDRYVMDTYVIDAYVPDTGAANSYVRDMYATDTYVTDTHVADTYVTNTCVTDTSVTNTCVTDTSMTDTSVIDTSVADTCASERVTQNRNDPSFRWYIKKRRKSSFQVV